MKEPQLSYAINNKIEPINSNLKPIPTKFKHNLISIKSLPESITGSKSFRQQVHFYTTKNSKEKDNKKNISENVSFEMNSQGKLIQNSKNKNMIVNCNNQMNFNYNPKTNLNFSNNKQILPSNNINNDNIKANLISKQITKEQSQYLRINTAMNATNPYLIQNINSNIYNKNKKNSNSNQKNKLMSCLTGLVSGYKGIIKGYNTTNNTANNSFSESVEKNNINKQENKKNKIITKKNIVKSIKSKYTNKPLNNNKESNLQKYNKKTGNKISQTAKNSRKNSGDKFIQNYKSKISSIKHKKLILNNIRELKINANIHKQNNKIISAQISNTKKGINLNKPKNNNCQTKSHILRKYNQDKMKLFNTNIKGKVNVSGTKIGNYNTNSEENFVKINNLLNLNNIQSNSAFSTRQNMKEINPLIKVNKSKKMINDLNDNNVSKGILYHPKYNSNFKKYGIFNVNEKSLEILKNKNQITNPSSYYFNKIDTEINKKVKTAGNSPGHSKTNEKISKDASSIKNKSGYKQSYQNVNQISSKDLSEKENKYKIPNLKSAFITRKNSKNKELKEYLNIQSDNVIIKKKELFYNDYNPNNSLRSTNSMDKENNNESHFNSNLNSNNNTKYNTNAKNSKKVFNSIINIGNNLKNFKKKKQNIVNNTFLENINELNKRIIHFKNNSSNNSKLKINTKLININSSPNSKIKYSHLYEKNKIYISDNNFQLKNQKNNITNKNLNEDKYIGIIKQKKKVKKIIIAQKNIENNKKITNNEDIKNNNEQKKRFKNKNLINKSKIEQILLQKEINKSKKINIINEIKDDEDLLNSYKNNYHENSSRSKIAKKSTHNRNVEQNSIFNSNNTNTSLLSTMKDSNYYSQESENLSKYIKDYYKSHSTYPQTDITFYKIGRLIGRGAFGKVNIGLNILTGRIVAIKSFNKQNILNEKAKKKILYETNLMRGLYHPSVTKILETFETDKYMLIIMEYISGGNLQNFVKKRRKLCEKTAKILYRQLIQGIRYIHSKGIVHRDIKLENILLDLNNIVKICDFGVGKLTKKGQKLFDQCGTPVYMAPEIVKGDGYEGFPVDVWSSGVALYIMLSGNIPFNRDKNHNLQSAIMNLPYKKIEGVSDNANDLLKNILEKDPKKRFTPDQILEHPWMIDGNDDEGSDYNYDLEIKNVNKYHLFTNAESILLAKTHIDYRKAPKKDLAENFTLKNLYTIEDKKNNKNIETKSIILAPYNSMITDSEEEEEENEENNDKIKNKKNKEKPNTKLESIEDIKIKAINYYNQSTNPFDILDNFNLEIQVKNGIIKFHGKVKEFNMNYELNNNEEIDNGMLINSKDELVLNQNEEEDQLENYLKNNTNNITNKENNKSKKSHRPNSPYKQPPINPYFVKMVCQLGYNKDYVVKSLEKNELNHATTIYYLFSNYENIK